MYELDISSDSQRRGFVSNLESMQARACRGRQIHLSEGETSREFKEANSWLLVSCIGIPSLKVIGIPSNSLKVIGIPSLKVIGIPSLKVIGIPSLKVIGIPSLKVIGIPSLKVIGIPSLKVITAL